jgi:hypothetical protein
MLKEFTDFWRKCDLSRKPYMHPEDQEFLQKKEFKSIINGCLTTDDKSTKLHLSLLPAPYTGNLAQADRWCCNQSNASPSEQAKARA